MGIAKNSFTSILQGKFKMQEKYKEAFLRAFTDLKVEEKTKDFKESLSQLSLKALYQKRNLLTSLAILFILISMNWVECIRCLLKKSQTIIRFFKRAFGFYSNAFLVLVKEIKSLLTLKLNYQVGLFSF
jgi:hypothetical protein